MAAYVMCAANGAGQVGPPAVFTPAAPTEHGLIRATFSVPGLCGTDSSTIVDGTTVRTTVALIGCVIGPPPFPQDLQVVFGPLPAGAYTYEIYLLFEEEETPELRSRQPLVVNALIPGVPTLLQSSRMLLLGLLAAAGLWTIGRAAL